MRRSALLVVFVLLASVGLARGQEPYPFDDRPKITVTGEAVVNATPDKVVINFGIETSDPAIVAAKEKNNEVLKKARAALQALGVADKDIQTDHLSIEPRWKSEHTNEGFIGYFVRNAFLVTVTDVTKVEPVVTAALQAGVNYLHAVDFQTTEFKKYREEARALALKAAKEKADKMAGVLGQSAGSPIQINESYGGSPWWYWSTWSGWWYGQGQGMSQNIVQNAPSEPGEAGATIALGKISIRASVSVTFELR